MKLNKKGFTLIELLAVIVIIAIIALIGIPSVTKIMANSRKDALKSLGINVTDAAKNKLASENYLVPASGCILEWNDLDMESNKISTGTVDVTKSYVRITVDGDQKQTHTVFIAAEASKGGIVGKNRTELSEPGDAGRANVVLGANVLTNTDFIDPLDPTNTAAYDASNAYLDCTTGLVLEAPAGTTHALTINSAY